MRRVKYALAAILIAAALIASYKLGAHVDKDVFRHDPRALWNLVDLLTILSWARQSLLMLLRLLEVDAYEWSRDPGGDNVMSLMVTDGFETSFRVADGQAAEVLGFQFARSPKYAVSDEVVALLKLVNATIEAVGPRN